ncbi:lytic transglycosylase domain-containing protein [Delftia sp. GW456-R20]|uniref:lytic transglycosylase domain-containing protein n=1 Tax=Delftia sp. GW456-R20 TaxID=1827145 RepID=UPI0012E82F6F
MIIDDVEGLLANCAPTVATTTMRAIVKTESGFRPNAIGYLIRKGESEYTLSRQPKNQFEAIQWATWLYANGYKFDAGAAQVNSSNFARVGLTPSTAFDPCKNISAGAAILTSEYARASVKFGPGQNALRAAISSYNSGSFVRGIHNGYVTRVEKAAASGFLPLISSTARR